MKREKTGRGAPHPKLCKALLAGAGLTPLLTSLPAYAVPVVYWDWLATPTSADIRLKANYTPPVGSTTTGSFSTNEQSNGTTPRFGPSSTTTLSIAGSSDVNWAGFEFAADAANFTISGSRVSYLHATGDDNRYIVVNGGSQSITNARMRGTGGGVILNNSPAATGLNLANGSNGLMVDPQNATPCNLVFDGTGTTSVNFFSVRSTARSMNLTKKGTGTLTITSSFATAPTSSPGYVTGTTTVLGGTLRVAVLADGGQPSSIGASSNSASNLVLNGGTFTYTGSTTATSDRLFNVGLLGAQLNASGTAPVTFSNTAPIEFNGESGPRTLTLGGTSSAENTLALSIPDEGGVNPTKLTKADAGKWRVTGNLTYTGHTEVTGGNLTIASAVRPVSSIATVSGANSSINFDTPASPSSSVVVANLDLLSLSSSGGASIVTTDRSVNKPRVATIDTLTISPGSIFNLNNNDLIVRSMSFTAVHDLIASWWNSGLRNGTGIGSALSASSLTTLVAIDNNNGGVKLMDTFDGIDVSLNSILVKYTYLGDTNYDGKVDPTDLAALINGLRNGLSGWTNGDTNYDGVVDASDYANLVTAMRFQGAQLDFGTQTFSAGAIPEPSALALLPLAFPLISRRRR